jgi:hypothetical protein
MRFGPIFAAFVLTAGLSAPADAAWRTYVNERFGVTADVPDDWKAGLPPTNGDGLDFKSPDGRASIVVSGSLNIADTIEEAIAMFEAPDEGETVTYKHATARSVVVSGIASDRIFYRKSILACHDQVWNSVSIEYPAADRVAYDALVIHVAHSLRAGKSEQMPDCP